MHGEIRGTNVILREQRVEDAAFFAHWFNQPQIMFQCGFTEQTDEEAERRMITVNHRSEDSVWFTITDLDGNPIGETGLLRMFPAWHQTDLTIIIPDPNRQHRGFGTEAIRLMLDMAFFEYDMHRVSIGVVGLNTDALAFYKKIGFRQEGILEDGYYYNGAYSDFIMMRILRHEWSGKGDRQSHGFPEGAHHVPDAEVPLTVPMERIKNTALPQQTESLIQGFAEESKRILADSLVGVYLHGSAVMGCFNPDKSDLDLLIVVDRPLSDSVKRAYMETVVRCSAAGPKKGIEMSVVLRSVCKPFLYPTPYELHFSEGHRKWYENDPDDYIRRMNGVDRDLAAHVTILLKRGRCVYGAPIDAVFAPVPPCDYLDSIRFDVADAPEEIERYPMYLTLNLARVLAYREEGLVLSKKEGGEWALDRLPEEYRPPIRDALREYTEGAEVVYDAALLKRYAAYAIGRIADGETND